MSRTMVSLASWWATVLGDSQQWKESRLWEEDDADQCELPLGLLSRDIGC